jgi:hypothetical protein
MDTLLVCGCSCIAHRSQEPRSNKFGRATQSLGYMPLSLLKGSSRQSVVGEQAS